MIPLRQANEPVKGAGMGAERHEPIVAAGERDSGTCSQCDDHRGRRGQGFHWKDGVLAGQVVLVVAAV